VSGVGMGGCLVIVLTGWRAGLCIMMRTVQSVRMCIGVGLGRLGLSLSRYLYLYQPGGTRCIQVKSPDLTFSNSIYTLPSKLRLHYTYTLVTYSRAAPGTDLSLG
jgi:hypothetical protein